MVGPIDLGNAKERWLLVLLADERLASKKGIEAMASFHKQAGVPFCLIPVGEYASYGQFWPASELPCLITPMGLVIGMEHIRALTQLGLAQLFVLFGDVRADSDQFALMLKHRLSLAKRAVDVLISAQNFDWATGCRYWERRYQATLEALPK